MPPIQCSLFSDTFDFVLKEVDTLTDKAAIRLQLGFPGTSGADAAPESL
jgi:hypothetical protein